MAQLPDVYCWIKAIDDSNGKVLPEGGETHWPRKTIVRYVVANDSNEPIGPMIVVGSLFRNGVRVQPGGQPNVIPAQQITVQPNQIWKKEYTVSESSSSGFFDYVAKLSGDVGFGAVDEEDESNNQAQRSFTYHTTPG